MIDVRTAPYAAFVLRVTLGVMYIAHSLIRSTSRSRSLVVAGIGTRWVSLALIPVLAGATWVHAGTGWVFSAANGGWAYPAFLIAVSLVQALLGDGRYALSTLVPQRKPQGAYA